LSGGTVVCEACGGPAPRAAIPKIVDGVEYSICNKCMARMIYFDIMAESMAEKMVEEAARCYCYYHSYFEVNWW